jgi:DNA-binding transcriptional ArsR family regulator
MTATTSIESVDDLVATLANARRRAALRYLRDHGEGPTPVADLADHIARRESGADR